jgi:branched-chain amino acid aminotransferase
MPVLAETGQQILGKNQRQDAARPSRNQSSADFPVCCIAGFPTREPREVTRPADWEIGDTAGLETYATPAATAGCATEKASQIATKFGDSTAKTRRRRAINLNFAPLRLRDFALKGGMFVFLNEKFVPEKQAVIPVSDRGFLLGDGLFETMRVANGRPFRLAQHLERLSRGADFLKIKLPFTPVELETFARQLIKRNQMPEAILRLTLTRGPAGRGYAPSGESKPTVVMTLHPTPSPSNPAGWNLVTSSFQIPAADPLASFKTTSKILHVLARAEAVERGADEALLLNTNGEVAETAGGNLFWTDKNKVCTVPTGCGILPGVTRAVVLEICQTRGLTVNQRVIKPEALQKFQGLFITQSVFGIVPVAELDGRPVTPSPVVERLAHAYGDQLIRP